MADPQTVAFACGVFFGLLAARLLRGGVSVTVRNTIAAGGGSADEDDDEDEGESWKNGR